MIITLISVVAVIAILSAFMQQRRAYVAELSASHLRRSLADAKHRTRELEHQIASVIPQPNVAKLLLAVAPQVRLGALGSALYEQGFVVDMIATAPLDAEANAALSGARD